MPHSGKRITPSPVGGRASSSRGTSWTKYGAMGISEEHAGIPTEITVVVDDITVIRSADSPSKYEDRPSSAALPSYDDAVPGTKVTRHTEWISERSVDDRTYRRHDELITVVVEG